MSEQTVSAQHRRPATWVLALIGGVFGVLYAYAVWNAIGNLVQSVQVAGTVGMTLNALGWFLWIFAAIFPILVWAGAFTIGYKRRVYEYALIMLVGLTLVAVFWLNVVSYVALNTSDLLG